ncbi:hypothetical protein BH11BAC6_BH11BAC6_06130 [soil metagenome]
MNKQLIYITVLFFIAFNSCKSVVESGQASYYANKFEGHKTASGATYKAGKLTAAHRTLPYGTKIKVTNLATGKTVKVKVNDRGPFVKDRIIDLSKKAAQKLGMINAGVAQVEIKYRKKKSKK